MIALSQVSRSFTVGDVIARRDFSGVLLFVTHA